MAVLFYRVRINQYRISMMRRVGTWALGQRSPNLRNVFDWNFATYFNSNCKYICNIPPLSRCVFQRYSCAIEIRMKTISVRVIFQLYPPSRLERHAYTRNSVGLSVNDRSVLIKERWVISVVAISWYRLLRTCF